MFKLRLVFEPLGVSIVVPRNQKQNKNKQECVLYSYRGCTRARIYSISSPPPKKKKYLLLLYPVWLLIVFLFASRCVPDVCTCST